MASIAEIKQWFNKFASTGGDRASLVTSGNIGGLTNIVSSNVVMSVAGAAATGDYVGTSVTPQYFSDAVLKPGGTGLIKSITIADKLTTTAVALELWLFSATFVAPTDNAAWAISDTESFTCLGVIPIATDKWYASSNNKVYSDDTLALGIKLPNTNLYYALVARGTTPVWTSLDLNIALTILQD